MRKLFYISIALSLTLSTNAQRVILESPQDVVNAFFKASSESNDSSRTAMFNAIFSASCQVNSINQRDSKNATSKLGSLSSFLEQSSSFYDSYSLAFDEVERSINYYEDIASVHSLVYQTVTEEKGIKTQYEQFLWYNFDLIYSDNGWLITSVSWINGIDSQPIDDALIQDTIWHTLKK